MYKIINDLCYSAFTIIVLIIVFKKKYIEYIFVVELYLTINFRAKYLFKKKNKLEISILFFYLCIHLLINCLILN